MYHCLNKSLFLAILITLTGAKAIGQTSAAGSSPSNGKDNNPYSKFGMGELLEGDNVVLKGMGGMSSAYANPFRANTENPASYSWLQRTAFEVGMTASRRKVTGSVNGTDESYKTGTASVNYMQLAFPVGKNAGATFGFRPYSNVYYYLYDTVKGGTTPYFPDDVVKVYNGEGGLNDAFLGVSAKFKNLSIGFNAGYLFGTVRNSSRLIPEIAGVFGDNKSYYVDFSTYTRTTGLHWKGGLQYEAKLDSTHKLRIGATLATSQNINQKHSEYQIASFPFSDTLIRDTVYNVTDVRGSLTLPMSYSIGVVLTGSDRWSVGLDYTATKWSDFSSELNANMNTNLAASTYKFSAGGEITPDPNAIKNYLSKVSYRLGGYYGVNYVEVNNNSLTYYGITAGLGLPFRRSLSQIQIAIDAGRLGTTDNGLTRHNYFKFSVGLSLSDLWFVKRKYN